MKKIFLSFLIFLSLSYAKDLDILSIASNGSLSDKTSHKLNDDELKQVVGGLYATAFKGVDYMLSYSGNYYFGIDWALVLEDEDKWNNAIYVGGNRDYYQAKRDYKHLIAISSKDEFPVLRFTYDSATGSTNYFFATLDKQGNYWRMADDFAKRVMKDFYYGVLQNSLQKFQEARLQLISQGYHLK